MLPPNLSRPLKRTLGRADGITLLFFGQERGISITAGEWIAYERDGAAITL